MKIPLDYFLYIIKNFLDEVGLKDASKILKNHIDIPEAEFDIFKFYCSSHPELKKFWKKKAKEMEEDYEVEAVEEVETKPSKKEMLNKKQKRPVDSDDEEEESEEVVKKSKKNTKEQSSETPLKKTKIEVQEPVSNGQMATLNGNAKTPFKRIDDSLKTILPKSLQDNSYEGLMTSTGEEYGKQANEKLKFTKGRDFKKEKTKFKNKTACGGLSISTEVRSIPLDTDSD